MEWTVILTKSSWIFLMSVMKSRHCLTVELWLEMWLRMQAWNKCWVASNLKSVKCCQGDLESMCHLYSALKTPTSKCLKHISFYSAICFSIMFVNFVAFNILSLFFLICLLHLVILRNFFFLFIIIFTATNQLNHRTEC